MNIQEDYVSFETAKLLKKKGFYWDWSPFYSEQDKDEWNKNNNYNIPNPNYDATIPFDSEILNVVAPHVSLQMAMKWLREIHKIHITVYPYGEHSCDNYQFDIYKNREYLLSKDEGYMTNEQAIDVAIEYCLENLVK